jgi:hypothetical protein
MSLNPPSGHLPGSRYLQFMPFDNGAGKIFDLWLGLCKIYGMCIKTRRKGRVRPGWPGTRTFLVFRTRRRDGSTRPYPETAVFFDVWVQTLSMNAVAGPCYFSAACTGVRGLTPATPKFGRSEVGSNSCYISGYHTLIRPETERNASGLPYTATIYGNTEVFQLTQTQGTYQIERYLIRYFISWTRPPKALRDSPCASLVGVSWPRYFGNILMSIAKKPSASVIRHPQKDVTCTGAS